MIDGRQKIILKLNGLVKQSQKKIEKLAKDNEKIKKYLKNKKIKKVVYVPQKVVNFVTE